MRAKSSSSTFSIDGVYSAAAGWKIGYSSTVARAERHLLLHPCTLVMPAGFPESSFVAKLPSVATTLRLDQLDLPEQVRLAGRDLLRERVAVPRRPAVVHDTAGRHEVVRLLDVDAEERLTARVLLGHVFDVHRVVHDAPLRCRQPLGLERDTRFDPGVQLVSHRRWDVRSDALREPLRRSHVEVEPATERLGRQPEPGETAHQHLKSASSKPSVAISATACLPPSRIRV